MVTKLTPVKTEPTVRRWPSPLYRVPPMHVIDDHRYGHTVLRVVGFKGREPAAWLFDVLALANSDPDHLS